MIKHIIIIFVAVLFLLLPQNAKSKFYVGLGADYIMPQTAFGKVNDKSLGYLFQIDARDFCKLWYGLRVEYFSLVKKPNISDNFFQKSVLISPEIRYNPFLEDCVNQKFIPYVIAMLTISSIAGTDDANQLGFGGSAGLGASYGFNLFKLCWTLDLNAMYSSPNFIARADNRLNLQSYNVSLILSVGL